jgi:hypothetical protein
MISAPAQSVLDEINDIVRLDGAEFHVTASGGSVLELSLNLSNSECPECVLPAQLLVDMLTARMAEADPDITEIRLHDPREHGLGEHDPRQHGLGEHGLGGAGAAPPAGG